MGKNCTVREDWFFKTDGWGHQINSWAVKKSEDSIFCKICMQSIRVSLKRFQAGFQHTLSVKDKNNSKTKLSPNQLRLTTTTPLPTASTNDQSVKTTLLIDLFTIHFGQL